jgi:hypothetical protein
MLDEILIQHACMQTRNGLAAVTRISKPVGRRPGPLVGARSVRCVTTHLLMLAVTDGRAAAAAAPLRPHEGECALCGTTCLTSMRGATLFCQMCLSLAPESTTLPAPSSTPSIMTRDGLGMRQGLKQQYLTKDQFKKAVADAAFANGRKAVRHNHTRSKATLICMVCKDKSCSFQVKATYQHGLWQLLGTKKQAWDHSPGCTGDAYRWPSLQDLASNPEVRGIILATQTTARFDAAMKRGDIARNVQNLGYTFPAENQQTAEQVSQKRNRLLRRARDKVLGFDREGIEKNLAALIPWVHSFNTGSDAANLCEPSHAHIETSTDGVFVSVTVVYGRACELVRCHGLRVFSMDACHFNYLRADLRLLVLAGFYAENKIAIVSVCVCLGETMANYAMMLGRVRMLPKFWEFFDCAETCLFIDRGSAINSAVKDTAVLTNGNAMYRHCYIHIVRNCEHKKIWGKCPVQLISILANSETEDDEKLALNNLKRAHRAVYNYVVNGMDRRRFIAHYSQHMDLKKTTSNAVEGMNSVAKTIGARETMPLQSIHLLTELVHKQTNEFVTGIASCLSQGKILTRFASDIYERSKQRAASLVVKNPQAHHPYGVHTISDSTLASAIGTATFQTCVAPGNIKCSCSTQLFERYGLPCEHMVCVATHRFPGLAKIGYTQEFGNGAKESDFMAQDFENWVQRSGLFFSNYVFGSNDVEFLRPQGGVSNEEFVPNIDDCLQRVTAEMSLPLPPVAEQNKATKQTKRFRSQGEVGKSSSVAAPRPVVPNIQAEAAQQSLLADTAIVGKHFMIVYNATNSNATFHDSGKTPVSGCLRPVTVVQRPQISNKDDRYFVKVRCALVDPKADSRNGVRPLLLARISECHPVDKITADMKKNKWERPLPQRVRQKTKQQPGFVYG